MPQYSPARAAALSSTATDPAPDLSQLDISVSQLLGYDYIFLGGPAAPDYFLDPSRAQGIAFQLCKSLGVAAEQSVFVTVEGQAEALRFTRHGLVWEQGGLISIQSTLIENPEQQEFINMIWQCSSALTL